MKLEKIGQWISIFANVGVLVGFIVVAYQLQLNTKALQTSSIHKTNELFANLETSLMGDTANEAFASAMIDPKELTPGQISQIWSLHSLGLFVATQTYLDYRNGVVSQEQWDLASQQYIGYINHPVGLNIWNKSKALYTDPLMIEFVEAIDEKLNRTPENLTQSIFLELVEELSIEEKEDT
jgi:hypothetical protein